MPYIIILFLIILFFFLFFKRAKNSKNGIIIYTYSSMEDMINKKPKEIKTIKGKV
jgi:hypothetical protein